MPPDKETIRRMAFDFGFDVVRFTAAVTTGQTQARLHAFLDDGLHGDMAWMSETAARRADPKVLWPEAKSVVVVGLNYGPDHDPCELLQVCSL